MSWRQIMVEVRVPQGASGQRMLELADELVEEGFDLDPDYMVPVETRTEKGRRWRKGQHSVLLRGRIEEGREAVLEAHPEVVRVWSDAPISEFSALEKEDEDEDEEKAPRHPFVF